MAQALGIELEEEPVQEVKPGSIHPLVKIWLGCQYWSTPDRKILPWDGGWLDWDLHESKGLQWLEELVEEIRKDINRERDAEEARMRAQEAGRSQQGFAPQR